MQVKNCLQEQRDRQRQERKFGGEQKYNLDLRCGDWVSARVREDAARHDINYAVYAAKRYERAVQVKKSPSRIDHQHLERNFGGTQISMQGVSVTRVHRV